MVQIIPIDNITIDFNLHARAEVDQKLVGAYAKEWLRGSNFPPVLVIGSHRWLGDGVHRTLAKKLAREQDPSRDDLNYIEADVIEEGSSADVLKQQSIRNRGKKASKQDLHATVQKALVIPELALLSNAELGRRLGISDHTVKKYRGAGAPKVVIGKDGKKRPAKVIEKEKPLSEEIKEVPLGEESLCLVGMEEDSSASVKSTEDPSPLDPKRIRVVDQKELTSDMLANVAGILGFIRESWALEILSVLRENTNEQVKKAAIDSTALHETVPNLPMQQKRDALPNTWVEALYDLLQADEDEERLLKLLDAYKQKYLQLKK